LHELCEIVVEHGRRVPKRDRIAGMFERNRIDTQDQGTMTVEATFDDGRELIGKLTLPAGRPLMEFLNGGNAYIEFEPLDGVRTILLKSSIKAVRAIAPAKAPSLTQRLRDLDGFDPYQILGLERAAAWEDVRSAYHRLAKIYHADRYATAELPVEVTAYLENMSRRVNAAYSTLETAYAQTRRYAKHRQEPIYTSPGR
jgi:hypothetical protein